MPVHRILVVDDSHANRRVLGDFLDGQGYEVTYAINGEEVIWQTLWRKPQLILIDLTRPGIPALRALVQAQATRHIPVILIAAQDAPARQYWQPQQGAHTCLPKPVNLHALLHLIAEFN